MTQECIEQTLRRGDVIIGLDTVDMQKVCEENNPMDDPSLITPSSPETRYLRSMVVTDKRRARHPAEQTLQTLEIMHVSK